MKRWSVPRGFASIEAALASDGRYDVISVCSPTYAHFHDVAIALKMAPRLVFCEKPVAPSVAETALLVESCRVAGVVLVVNYTRRWDPSVRQLREDLRRGEWGAIRSVSGVYNKGILNNGSHMIDLLHLLLGPMEVRATGVPVLDLSVDDPTIPALLVGPGNTSVHLSCGHAKDFSLFELQIVTEQGVISMEDGGMYWRLRRAGASPNFSGYHSLDGGERRPGGYRAATLSAVTEIFTTVIQGGPISSSGENALAAQRVCETIRGMAGFPVRHAVHDSD
jgi:predicted dehydrogenase